MTHEDDFPSRPSRTFPAPVVDIVEYVNRMCMVDRQARAARARRAFQDPRYLVETGCELNVTTHFSEFAAALAFLEEHINDDQHPRLLGAHHDGESSGLTDDEWDAVFSVYELRNPKVRRA